MREHRMRTDHTPSGLRTVRRCWIIRIARVVIVALLGAIALLYFRQHDLVYHPRPYDAEFAKPLAGVLELRFASVAGEQSAFYVPRDSGDALPERLWVAFSGNGSLALEWLGLI